MFILQILAVTWILGIVLIGGVFAAAVWKLGGFNNYAETVNLMADRPIATSNKVQWYVVLIVLFWPVVLVWVPLALRRRK